MRDFISGFAAGFAGGVEKGAAIGLKARDLQQERESDAATLARQIAADKATAEYRKTTTAETGRHNLATEGASAATAKETGRHNTATENTAAINAKTNRDRADAYIQKNSGIDPGLESHLGGTVEGYTPKTGGGTGGAVTTPPAVTTPAATGGDKSITYENELIPAYGTAGETGEDPDEEDQ